MKIYFIGAGPGDPELITLKAQKIIKKALIIIYAGSLVNEALLKWRKKDARVYNSASMDLKEVLAVYKKHMNKEGVIARIHTGDPSLYSAIQEQIAWCEENGVCYEVVPGVSSFCAASAALKQELTLPGVSQTVIISRLSGKTKVPAEEDLEKLAAIRATLIIFLSVQKIEVLAKKLSSVYPLKTPVAVVCRASWPDERIVTGTLETIAQKVTQARIGRQALIIVGDVLKKKGFRASKLYTSAFSHMYRQGK